MAFIIEYPNGPWKKLFFGEYDGFALSIYFNQEGFVLSEILNTEKTKVVLTISQILGVFGDAETFVETIPRNAIFLLQHGKTNEKYILLLGEQEVLEYVQKDISDFVNDQFKKLKKDSKGIMNIANSYEINLRAYSELTPEMRVNIFANPLNLFSFITQSRQPKSYTNMNATETLIKQEMFLGFYKTTNEKAVEPLDLFSRTFIFGNNNKCLQVLLEDLSLNKMNSVVFTYDIDINNLKYPNESPEVQEKNKSAPVGFPLVNYSLGKEININLQDLPENAFCELLQIKNSQIKDIINYVLKEKKALTLDSLINDVSNLQATEEFTSYNINLAIRILNLVKQEYPGIFTGDFSVTEFFKDSGRSMGTINLVSLTKDNPLASKLIIYNTLKKISNYSDKNKKIVIVIQNFDDLFSRKELDVLSKELFKLILEDKNYYIISMKNEIDLNNDLASTYTAKLSMLEDNEIGITLKDAKPFRFVLRPSLSK